MHRQRRPADIAWAFQGKPAIWRKTLTMMHALPGVTYVSPLAFLSISSRDNWGECQLSQQCRMGLMFGEGQQAPSCEVYPVLTL